LQVIERGTLGVQGEVPVGRERVHVYLVLVLRAVELAEPVGRDRVPVEHLVGIAVLDLGHLSETCRPYFSMI
jgi:hypothetical protein